MPSSISVGDTRSPRLTTNLAICLTLMTYLLLSESFSSGMILVHRATCSGCSSDIRCRSAAMSQRCGGASPVSDSLTPVLLSANRIDDTWRQTHTDLLVYARLFVLDLLLELLERCRVRSRAICLEDLDVPASFVSPLIIEQSQVIHTHRRVA